MTREYCPANPGLYTRRDGFACETRELPGYGTSRLFAAQGFGRGEAGGTGSRVEAREDADEHGRVPCRRSLRPSPSASSTGSEGWTIIVVNTTDEMLPDDLNELVQPFRRGENSRISAVPGVGLGLSIAQAATGAMGATLRLSRPDTAHFAAEIRLDMSRRH